jgi:hypothetical protein
VIFFAIWSCETIATRGKFGRLFLLSFAVGSQGGEEEEEEGDKGE